MDKTIHSVSQPEYHLPEVERVAVARPLAWIAAGWRDLLKTPSIALIYGAVFALLGWGLYAVSEGAPHFTITYVAGFFLAGPFLAAGLYAVAHRLEHGKPASLYHALTAWHRSGLQMLIYAAIIAILMVFWIRFSWLFIGLVFHQNPTLGMAESIGALSATDDLGYLAIYLALGAAFAALVFAISVVALPMLQDRRVDIVTAMLTSLRAVRRNPGSMLLWAVLVVALTAVGFATLLLGLVITFPLLGYATWHAYRDLVPRQH